MSENKQFPDGMVPLGDTVFNFECHKGLECFTLCCRNVDMILYPYDIIRMKTALNIDSSEFLRRHTILVQGDNPFFPTVKLKLADNESKSCPFLSDSGCNVYPDRPTACRTYPLERAVERNREDRFARDFYFKTSHSYCLGHSEKRTHSVNSWIRNQKLFEHNLINDLWTEIDTLFSTNPWKGEGAAGEKQQLAFLVCYNIDEFRRFSQKNRLIGYFQLEKDVRRNIEKDDCELLKFGFEWLKLIFSGVSSLIKK
ncbi:MAG: YkgJ family cysteine cluster protein [Desulforhopalus sp.]|nr:YkgJ family cysteine cluster protein [Desulforhopalus sp.]